MTLKKGLKIISCFILFIQASCTGGLYHDDATGGADPQKEHLRQLFKAWQSNEIAQGHIWAKDSCSIEWLANHGYKESENMGWGFPDSSGVKFSYADLNNDGNLDQMVTFSPAPCNGGKAFMWTQIEVLTVSEHNEYKTTASSADGALSFLGKDSSGFYWYDSIGVNRIYARFYNFKKGDKYCCPSTVKRVMFAFDTKQIMYIEDGIKK